MAIANIGHVTYSDFKMLEVIDPEQFDRNNKDLCEKIDQIINLVNQYLSTDPNASGADNIFIATVGTFTANTVQKFIEQLNTKLTSSGSGDSGADFVKAGSITGLTGNTVQSVIESLKAYVDAYNIAHKLVTSSDHDNRYYTKTQVDAINYDSRYYTETESDTKFATKDELITFTLGEIVDNTLTTAKMATEQKRGVANGVASLDGTGNVPLDQLGNLPPVDFTPIEDDITALQNDITTLETNAKDMGRNQSEFGFSNAIYQDTILTNNTVKLISDTTKQIDQLKYGYTVGDSLLGGTYVKSVTPTTRVGQTFNSNITYEIDYVTAVTVRVDGISGSGGGLICTVYDNTKKVAVGTKTIAGADIVNPGMNTFTFDSPIAFTRGNELQIRFYAADVNKTFNIAFTDRCELQNTHAITTTNSWTTISDLDASVCFRLYYTVSPLLGTVIKSIKPDNIETWSNLKWSETGNANTTVTCDILEGNDLVAEYVVPIYRTAEYCSDTTWMAQRFTSAIATPRVNVTLPLYRDTVAGALIRNNFTVNIYTENSGTGNPQTSIGSATINYLDVPFGVYSSPYLVTVSMDLTQNLQKGQHYFIVLKGAVSGAGLRWAYHNNLIYDSSGVAYDSSNSGSTWANRSDYNFPYKVTIDPIVVIPEVKSFDDLSDIDVVAYPSLKVKWILERNAVSDISPTIYNPSYTWLGANILTKVDPSTDNLVLRSNGERVVFDSETISLLKENVLTVASQTVTFEIPTGYSRYYIEYVAKSSRTISTESDLQAQINNRTGATDYRHTFYSPSNVGGFGGSDATYMRLGIISSSYTVTNQNWNWACGKLIIIPSNSVNMYTYVNGEYTYVYGTSNSISNGFASGVCKNSYEPVTSIKLFLSNSDNFVSGSQFRLYGVK